jgi:hypothetical protein
MPKKLHQDEIFLASGFWPLAFGSLSKKVLLFFPLKLPVANSQQPNIPTIK